MAYEKSKVSCGGKINSHLSSLFRTLRLRNPWMNSKVQLGGVRCHLPTGHLIPLTFLRQSVTSNFSGTFNSALINCSAKKDYFWLLLLLLVAAVGEFFTSFLPQKVKVVWDTKGPHIRFFSPPSLNFIECSFQCKCYVLDGWSDTKQSAQPVSLQSVSLSTRLTHQYGFLRADKLYWIFLPWYLALKCFREECCWSRPCLQFFGRQCRGMWGRASRRD